jgi:hypothetical protein
METQAWTAIGLLAATLVEALFYLGNGIDVLGSEMRSEMRSQFEAQGSRIDTTYSRIETMSGRLDSLTASTNTRASCEGRLQRDVGSGRRM